MSTIPKPTTIESKNKYVSLLLNVMREGRVKCRCKKKNRKKGKKSELQKQNIHKTKGEPVELFFSSTPAEKCSNSCSDKSRLCQSCSFTSWESHRLTVSKNQAAATMRMKGLPLCFVCFARASVVDKQKCWINDFT